MKRFKYTHTRSTSYTARTSTTTWCCWCWFYISCYATILFGHQEYRL